MSLPVEYPLWTQDESWHPYSPAIGVLSGTVPSPAGVTIQACYRVVGKTMHIKYMRTGSASATAGVGTYTGTIPAGFSIDTTRCIPDAAGLATAQGTDVRLLSLQLGIGAVNDGGQSCPMVIHPASSTTFVFQATDWNASGHTRLTGSSWFPLTQSDSTLYAELIFPIL